MNKFYKNLGIYDLRIYARQLGVKSPTTLTKKLIICEIEKIITGKIIPLKNKENRGRPSKYSPIKFYEVVDKTTNNKKIIYKKITKMKCN